MTLMSLMLRLNILLLREKSAAVLSIPVMKFLQAPA
jgi:hypothetical protein